MTMSAMYILPVLACVFLAAGFWRMAHASRRDPAARTWLLIAFLFAAVSAWLWHTT